MPLLYGTRTIPDKPGQNMTVEKAHSPWRPQGIRSHSAYSSLEATHLVFSG